MDADRALKKLFKLRATDLLPVTGDRGAEVLPRQVPELDAVTRRLDFVLKLKRGNEVYLRHLEFEMKLRKGLTLRVFEYAAARRIKEESSPRQCRDCGRCCGCFPNLRMLRSGRIGGRTAGWWLEGGLGGLTPVAASAGGG